MTEPLVASGRLFAAIVLVLLNGFFVASEFAYVRVRATAVDQLVAEGRRGATTLRDALDNLDNYLAVTQLGITLASLGLGWLGEPAVATLLEPVLAGILPGAALHVVSFVIAFSFITFLHVVFGELAPKTIAIAEAERIAILVSPPMKFCYYLFLPGLVVFNGTANWVTSAIGIPPASETDETLTEEELRMVLSRSGREGHIGDAEVTMIERVFELDDVTAREVMVPRPDVVTVASDDSIDALRATITEADHTRYPVIDAAAPDQVVGFVDVKDLLRADADDDSVEDLVREIPIVPETMPIAELLTTFQRERCQVGAVIDEWGAFEGFVTVEDVVEQLVGELHDRYDEAAPKVDRRPDGTTRLDGSTPLTTVNDRLDTDFDPGAYTTIGGFLLGRIGGPPEPGDEVEIDGYRIIVEAVDGQRITEVVAEPVEEAT